MPLDGEQLEILADLVTKYNEGSVQENQGKAMKDAARDEVTKLLRSTSPPTREVVDADGVPLVIIGCTVKMVPYGGGQTINVKEAEALLSADHFNKLAKTSKSGMRPDIRVVRTTS